MTLLRQNCAEPKQTPAGVRVWKKCAVCVCVAQHGRMFVVVDSNLIIIIIYSSSNYQ